MTPVIGVLSRALRVDGRSRPFLGAFDSYLEAVTSCGAEPVILPMSRKTGALALCDGVVLTGGEDLATPELWVNSAPGGATDPRRDAFETAIVLRSREAGLPVLAMCRGAQLVNCLLGGTLTRMPPHDGCDHGSSREAFHRIQVQSGSELCAAFGGATEISVLSRHSALIAELGRGLRPVAWAPDGSVEAFEGMRWPCIGVLWHPEWAGRESVPDLALFRWLTEMARRREQ